MNELTKYILVTWPEIQNYMDHPRYKECYVCDSLDEDDNHVISTYMVPEDLYCEVEHIPQEITISFEDLL